MTTSERQKAYMKRWRAKNGEYLREKERTRWREKKAGRSGAYRNWMLRAKYGLTLENYEAILQSQGFSCGICRRHQDEFKKALAVDHDHESGDVRGLLCPECNTGLGALRDGQLFQDALNYMERA